MVFNNGFLAPENGVSLYYCVCLSSGSLRNRYRSGGGHGDPPDRHVLLRRFLRNLQLQVGDRACFGCPEASSITPTSNGLKRYCSLSFVCAQFSSVRHMCHKCQYSQQILVQAGLCSRGARIEDRTEDQSRIRGQNWRSRQCLKCFAAAV